MLSDSEHKMSVVVLFGGMSSEHEVSRVSAGTFVDQLDRQRYELLTIGITKEGRWLYTEADSAQMADGSWEELPGNMPCYLSSLYIGAANKLKPKCSRRKIIAYVESYGDISFWRTLLGEYENETRYFEVMLPSKTT